MDRQLPIPGLERLKEARANADEKLQALQDRILQLELEVSILRLRAKPMSFIEKQIETILEEKRGNS